MIGEVIDPGSVPRIGDYVNIRGGTFVYTDRRHADWLPPRKSGFRDISSGVRR
jgi:hypothetical protein